MLNAEVIHDDDGVWYKGKDVIQTLGFSETNVTNHITKNVPEKHRKKYFDGSNEYWVISSYGVGMLVLKSKSKVSERIINKLCTDYIPHLL